MKLTEPTIEYDEQIQAFRKEFLESGMSMDGGGALIRYEKTEDWLEYVQMLKSPDTMPAGMVPSTQFIYIRKADNKVTGIIQIRHYLNEYLLQYGGHIGYSTAPSERRKGYATQMLNLVLPECRKLGISRVLITCIKGNEGSRKTILRCGGVFESEIYDAENDRYFERYWIDLSE